MFLPVRDLNSAWKGKEGATASGEGTKRGFLEADSVMSQEG